jgi:hypothetical protein
MERELWPLLDRTVREVAAASAQKYVQLPGWVILVTFRGAALHDRPVSWACQPEHGSATPLRPPRWPSPATLSPRVQRSGWALLGQAVEQRLRQPSADHPALVAFLEGKPGTVGGATENPDARSGRAVGGLGKGYPLHTVGSKRALPEAWAVPPLNSGEATVARPLVPQVAFVG